MITELTCFIITVSDSCKSDQSIVDAFSKCPVFQLLKHNSRDEGEEHEKDDDADEHADDVLAKRPRASVFAVAETARSEEASIERSTQPPSDSSECHQLKRYANQCVDHPWMLVHWQFSALCYRNLYTVHSNKCKGNFSLYRHVSSTQPTS